MHLVRIDQDHATGRRQVVAAAMAEALGAALDHGEDVTFVHMRSEALFDVARMQQFDAAEFVGAPEAGLFYCSGVHVAPSPPEGSHPA
ncbi:hypothetical protein D3C76_632510 [compost metagenome]